MPRLRGWLMSKTLHTHHEVKGYLVFGFLSIFGEQSRPGGKVATGRSLLQRSVGTVCSKRLTSDLDS